MEDKQIPTSVQPLLCFYMEGLDRELPGVVGGVYLHGSIGQGSFSERYSDVDLVVVLNAVLDEIKLDRLADLHRAIEASFLQHHLEVNYLQWGDIGRPRNEIPPVPYYYGGRLLKKERPHISPITWWNLKYNCLTLRGPQPAEFPYQVTWADLDAWIRRSLNRYWLHWTSRPRNLIALLKDEVACWSVLGICQDFYNLSERNVISKDQAGEYALRVLPPERTRIVREALRLRAGTQNSYYRWRVGRALDARRFIQIMVKECCRIAG